MARRLAGQGAAVIAVADSLNEKIGRVSATTVSIEGSCPTTCALRNRGCYGQDSFTGMMVRRMDAYVAENNLDETQVAQAEADAIDGIWSGRALRMHVAGDSRTDEAARIVSSAAERYTSRNGQPAWTYTHAWRDVARESWGGVSVLASCETPDDALTARERGYAGALVVERFENGKRSWTLPTGQTAIPCPEQTGASPSCTACKLCWNDAKLRERNAVIAFAAHGTHQKKVRQTLTVLNS